MTPTEYGVLAFSSLFVIVDPIATVPAYLAMTARYTLAQRLRMARVACLVAFMILSGFALVGQWLFSLLGISLAAVQVAGALVLLLVALDMFRVVRYRPFIRPRISEIIPSRSASALARSLTRASRS